MRMKFQGITSEHAPRVAIAACTLLFLVCYNQKEKKRKEPWGAWEALPVWLCCWTIYG